MNKYIRTKDGIFGFCKTNVYGNIELIEVYRSRNSPLLKVISEKDIINQADDIKELCDEFVDITHKDYYTLDHKNGITYAYSKTHRFIGHVDIRCEGIGQIMGAIFTDKGLIYVAKMNEKGELELL